MDNIYFWLQKQLSSCYSAHQSVHPSDTSLEFGKLLIATKNVIRKNMILGYPERCHNHCFNLGFNFNRFWLHSFFGHLPFKKKIEVVQHFPQNCRSFSIFKKIKVVFHFQKNVGRLLFSKKLRSFSIFKKVEVVFPFQTN